MLRLWKRQQVIADSDLLADQEMERLLHMFAESNTADKWCERARALMQQAEAQASGAELWGQIAQFFEFGRDVKMAAFAVGKQHLLLAQDHETGTPHWRRLVEKAAGSFRTGGFAFEVAECLEQLQVVRFAWIADELGPGEDVAGTGLGGGISRGRAAVQVAWAATGGGGLP